jgi:hypothetical protein
MTLYGTYTRAASRHGIGGNSVVILFSTERFTIPTICVGVTAIGDIGRVRRRFQSAFDRHGGCFAALSVDLIEIKDYATADIWLPSRPQNRETSDRFRHRRDNPIRRCAAGGSP